MKLSMATIALAFLVQAFVPAAEAAPPALLPVGAPNVFAASNWGQWG